jgi:type II secretory pathway pseudopilin PulG
MKKALTIGELLVTMAIIGIVATLVLPGVMKDYQKKLFTTKLKKSIELIDNAVNQACIDNGVSYFYQTPYVAGSQTTSQKFIDTYFKKASNTSTYPFASKYKDISTQTEKSIGLGASHGYAKLAGGEALSFYCDPTTTTTFCVFRIDVNSTDAPNVGGRDFFMVYLDRKTNMIYDNDTSDKCGTDLYGTGCYAKLIENNWDVTY